MKRIFIDTGPMISLLNKRDSHHLWATQRLNQMDEPMTIVTASVTEVLFILKRMGVTAAHFFNWVDEGILVVENPYPEKKELIHRLYGKYSDIPVSFADICLLAAAYSNSNVSVFTLDSDFLLFRNSKGKPLDLISPFA
ncbi:hypothetical protein DDZ15_11055 [Rhodohalobacter mucosus]|uniref:PIN domain-containing protein n=2 Tax=Rhodohalobacter mucosus TaxID=2079485 RepID=A0A316TRV0_9BACT|nr:hypothetical protein DDZ15_11055 [Rhodohalobacter mucosus]